MKRKLIKANTVVFIPTGFKEQLYVVTRVIFDHEINQHVYNIKSLKNYHSDWHAYRKYKNVVLDNYIIVCPLSSILLDKSSGKSIISIPLFYHNHPEYLI